MCQMYSMYPLKQAKIIWRFPVYRSVNASLFTHCLFIHSRFSVISVIPLYPQFHSTVLWPNKTCWFLLFLLKLSLELLQSKFSRICITIRIQHTYLTSQSKCTLAVSNKQGKHHLTAATETQKWHNETYFSPYATSKTLAQL